MLQALLACFHFSEVQLYGAQEFPIGPTGKRDGGNNRGFRLAFISLEAGVELWIQRKVKNKLGQEGRREEVQRKGGTREAP